MIGNLIRFLVQEVNFKLRGNMAIRRKEKRWKTKPQFRSGSGEGKRWGRCDPKTPAEGRRGRHSVLIPEPVHNLLLSIIA